MKKCIYKEIYKMIKKSPKIVIARHVGPDPDALGSAHGLKEAILNTFPDKEVYTIGHPAKKFDFLGKVDKFDDSMYDALLIVTDTPDRKRVDGAIASRFKYSIKIDHHPFVEKFCDIEWIDSTASSASQMVAELIFNTKLKLNDASALKLYAGIIADTNRFMFEYCSSKTFEIASQILKNSNIKITEIYDNLYMRNIKEIKFYGYLIEKLRTTLNGVGYIKITDKELVKYNVDAGTPGNMVNNFNHIDEALIWVTMTEDKDLGSYRISIRSRGPVINEIAAEFGGGGHIYASGVRLKDEKEMDKLIEKLDECAKEYRKSE
jgi:phosphoesterase RecJ-like protein